MKTIPDSGYYNTNKFARIFLESIKEITGENGLNSIHNYSYLSALIESPPQDNLNKEFDFAHFSMINGALEEIYGLKGGRGLLLRIGRITFDDVLKDYGALAGVVDITFKVLPIKDKIKFGLNAMAKLFSDKSDQISTVEEFEDYFSYKIERCPVCWGRESEEHSICYYMIGLLQEGLHWVSGGKEYQIRETRCIALKDEICEFIIPKESIDKN